MIRDAKKKKKKKQLIAKERENRTKIVYQTNAAQLTKAKGKEKLE